LLSAFDADIAGLAPAQPCAAHVGGVPRVDELLAVAGGDYLKRQDEAVSNAAGVNHFALVVGLRISNLRSL
jgi:hypothetical protein